MFLYPHKTGSKSAKSLAEAMNIKRIKLEGSKFKGSPEKHVINWGASKVSEQIEKCQILNKPAAVAMASNKLMFFNKVRDKVSIPDFTTKTEEVEQWLQDGHTVVARTTLTGHSGEGIHIIETLDQFNAFPKGKVKMWVKYIPKKDEYRVHVVAGNVVDVRRKGLRSDFNKDFANWKVRNHDNGFVFVKNDVDPPEDVLTESILAVAVCDLDFGAVDVVWNNFRNKAYVLEINTAPGLEGSTIDSYSEGFNWLYENEARYNDWVESKDRISKVNRTFSKQKLLGLSMAELEALANAQDQFNPPPQPVYHLDDPAPGIEDLWQVNGN